MYLIYNNFITQLSLQDQSMDDNKMEITQDNEPKKSDPILYPV